MTLTIDHISHERHYQPLFPPVYCLAHPGECVEIRGANGSGKSTLLRIIAGLIEPYQGNILWQQKPIMQEKEKYQQIIHYVGHQNGIKQGLTVEENVMLAHYLRNKKIDKDQIAFILRQFSLDTLNHRLVNQLSAGQARRLSLAKLLVFPAILWILDEPLTALDSTTAHYFTQVLSQHLSAGGIAIIATHQDIVLPNSIKTIQLGKNNGE